MNNNFKNKINKNKWGWGLGENKLKTTTMKRILVRLHSTKNYLLSTWLFADVLHLLMSTELAIFELYFDLNDNDSDVDKFD